MSMPQSLALLLAVVPMCPNAPAHCQIPQRSLPCPPRCPPPSHQDKKLKGKAPSVTVNKTEPCDSFFNFFRCGTKGGQGGSRGGGEYWKPRRPRQRCVGGSSSASGGTVASVFAPVTAAGAEPPCMLSCCRTGRRFLLGQQGVPARPSTVLAPGRGCSAWCVCLASNLVRLPGRACCAACHCTPSTTHTHTYTPQDAQHA